MENNIIVVGPNNAGKSTLCGYLKALNTTNAENEKFIYGIKGKIGESWKESEYYRYFIDTGHKEYIDQYNPKESTSKFIHIFMLNRFTYIDTPGLNTPSAKVEKYFSLGEYCLFVIDMNTLITICHEYENSIFDMRNYSFMQQLKLWIEIRGLQNISIVISKCDKLLSEEYDVVRIENFKLHKKLFIKAIYENCVINEMQEVNIIPISINGYNKTAKNIDVDHSCFKSLFSKTNINEIQNRVDMQEKATAAFFAIFDRTFIKEGKKYFRIKCVSGVIKVDDDVIIGPLKNKNHSNIFSMQGKVKSIMQSGSKEIVNSTMSKMINGLSIVPKNRRLKSKDISLQKTSIVVHPNSYCTIGSTASFLIDLATLDESHRSIVDLLDVKISLVIMWFGKRIVGTVVCKNHNKDEETLTITLHFNNELLIIPSSEYSKTNIFIIEQYNQTRKQNEDRKNTSYDNYTYTAALVKIGFIEKVNVTIADKASHLKAIKYFNGCMCKEYVSNDRYLMYSKKIKVYRDLDKILLCKKSLGYKRHNYWDKLLSEHIKIKFKTLKLLAKDLPNNDFNEYV